MCVGQMTFPAVMSVVALSTEVAFQRLSQKMHGSDVSLEFGQ